MNEDLNIQEKNIYNHQQEQSSLKEDTFNKTTNSL